MKSQPPSENRFCRKERLQPGDRVRCGADAKNASDGARRRGVLVDFSPAGYVDCMKKVLLFATALLVWAGCDANRTVNLPADSPRASYLLFPQADASISPDRAIIVSGEELSADEPITFYVNNHPHTIGKSDLSLFPHGPQSVEHYIRQLNNEIATWGDETDYKHVRFSMTGNNTILTVYCKNGKRAEYKYTIIDDLTPAHITCFHSL